MLMTRTKCAFIFFTPASDGRPIGHNSLNSNITRIYQDGESGSAGFSLRVLVLARMKGRALKLALLKRHPERPCTIEMARKSNELESRRTTQKLQQAFPKGPLANFEKHIFIC